VSDERDVLVSVRDLEVRADDRLLASLPSLDVRRGECVALVGESGSGKTTTLTALLGLTPGLRVSGRVTVAGVDVLTTGGAEVRGSHLALISQSPQASLNPTMRLGTLMRRALRLHGVRGARARERVETAMASVLLDPALLRRYPHQVSGGQAQRFAIALAVALEAGVILADEPTSALDVTVQAEVMGLLARLKDELGTALVLVSHDLALVSGIADHVVVMRSGEVVESGPAGGVLGTPAADYTRELLEAVPTIAAGEAP
jgi:peptide/nickel transport system ATP-binding protein